MEKILFTAVVLIVCCSVMQAFLLDDQQNLNHVTPSPHDDYHDLVELIVEEKTLRHRLEGTVANLEKAFTELARKCDSCTNGSSGSSMTLESDLTSVKAEVRNLSGQITSLSSNNLDIQSVKAEVNNLTSKIATVYTNSADLTSVKAEVRNLSGQIASLNTNALDIQNVKAEVNNLTGKIAAVTTKGADIFNLSSEVYELKSKAVNSTNPGYFFTVTNPSSHNGVFNKVISNIGDAYHVNSGEFVCKRNGIYYFTYTIINLHTQRAYCCIQHNNVESFCSNGYAADSSRFASATASVFYNLSVNDTVSFSRCYAWDYVENNSHFAGGSIVLY